MSLDVNTKNSRKTHFVFLKKEASERRESVCPADI